MQLFFSWIFKNNELPIGGFRGGAAAPFFSCIFKTCLYDSHPSNRPFSVVIIEVFILRGGRGTRSPLSEFSDPPLLPHRECRKYLDEKVITVWQFIDKPHQTSQRASWNFIVLNPTFDWLNWKIGLLIGWIWKCWNLLFKFCHLIGFHCLGGPGFSKRTISYMQCSNARSQVISTKRIDEWAVLSLL